MAARRLYGWVQAVWLGAGCMAARRPWHNSSRSDLGNYQGVPEVGVR